MHRMAEVVGTVGEIVGIIDFGLKLAVSFLASQHILPISPVHTQPQLTAPLCRSLEAKLL